MTVWSPVACISNAGCPDNPHVAKYCFLPGNVLLILLRTEHIPPSLSSLPP